MRRAIPVMAVLLLAGCAAQRLQEAKDQEAAADQACRVAYPKGTRGHDVDRVSCLITARDNFIQKVDPQDMDLEAVQDAEQLKLAADVDAGRITYIDAQVEFAKIHSQIVSQSEDRRHQRAMDAAAILAAAPAPPSIYLPQPYQMPAPQPVTCNSNAWAPGHITTTCN